MPLNNRILFVSPPCKFLQEPDFVPNLGLLYISSALKNYNWSDGNKPRTRYLELANFDNDEAIKKLIEEIKEYNPKFLAFTSTTPQYEVVKFLVEHVKRNFKDVKYLIGGPHSTNYRDYVNEDQIFDYIFIGESEEQIINFWNHYLHDFLEHIYSSIQEIDVNKIPMPDWEIDGLNIELYNSSIEGDRAFPIITSRGCDYSCAFCENKPKGRRRERKIDLVKDEIKLLLRNKIIRAFVFYDCCIVIGKNRAMQLKKMFKEINDELNVKPKWRAFMRADVVDFEIINILKEAGCYEIGFGIESGSDEILKNIKKDPCNRQANTDAIRVCREVGIKNKAFLVVGFPGETKKTINETIDWVYEAEPDKIDISLYMPYKGSDISNNPEKYKIQIYTKKADISKMYYKGKEGIEFTSFVSTYLKKLPGIIPYCGLSRQNILEKFKDMLLFKKRYNSLLAHSKINEKKYEENKDQILESYRILSNFVIHEGELIWRQLSLFISTNTLFILALGFFTRLQKSRYIILSIAILGLFSSFFWWRIYIKSWLNQKTWFYLIRKQELTIPFVDNFLEGALIRSGKRVNDFMKKEWQVNNFQKLPITKWVMGFTIIFILFWSFIAILAIFFENAFISFPLNFPNGQIIP